MYFLLLPLHLVCVHFDKTLRKLLGKKEQNYACPFPICFGFESTLDPKNSSPFVGTLIMTCAQNHMHRRRKTQLAIKNFTYLTSQKYFITARQEKNMWIFLFLLFVTFVFCVTKPVDQEDLNQLKIPTASSKNFPSRKKKDSAHLVCVHVFREKNSETCQQTRSITMS